jgi:hypothetical protein
VPSGRQFHLGRYEEASEDDDDAPTDASSKEETRSTTSWPDATSRSLDEKSIMIVKFLILKCIGVQHGH